MSPRRNSIGYSRRRTTRRPEVEQSKAAVGWDALARELVRRGLAPKSIVDQPAHPTEGKKP